MAELFASETLVLVGHGSTKDDQSAAPVYQHAGVIRQRAIFREVREAFLRQGPYLAEVIGGLREGRAHVVPMFISRGYYTGEVIPKLIGLGPEGTAQVSPAALHYTEPVGTHPRMTEVILARAREVAERFPFPHCPNPRLTTLIVAGHGTKRNEHSREAIEAHVGLIRERGVYGAVQPAFLEEPPLLAHWGDLAETRNVVIVPFFMSDGLHVREDLPVLLGDEPSAVRSRLANRQNPWRNPTERGGKLVWCSGAVGSAPLLAEVVLERVRERAGVGAEANADWAGGAKGRKAPERSEAAPR